MEFLLMRLTRISVYFYLSALFVLSPILNRPTEAQQKEFTRQDRLRGSVTPERAWWDLQHYQLTFEVFPETQTLAGTNEITFTVLDPQTRMQIDLQEPLKIDKIEHGEQLLKFQREGSVYWVDFAAAPARGSRHTIKVHYACLLYTSPSPRD